MTEHKFTDEEIIRALGERTHSGKWIGKGFLDKQDFLLLISALDLINRQKANLQEVITLNSKLEAEIERLTHRCDDCAGCTQWKCDCSIIKAEAIKEFAEKIKIDAEWICDDNYIERALIEYIDNLVKEMTEEKTKT